jgi:hypothetical protein
MAVCSMASRRLALPAQTDVVHVIHSLGMIVLATWLLLAGLTQLVGLTIPVVVMVVLAAAAGALILYKPVSDSRSPLTARESDDTGAGSELLASRGD